MLPSSFDFASAKPSKSPELGANEELPFDLDKDGGPDTLYFLTPLGTGAGGF